MLFSILIAVMVLLGILLVVLILLQQGKGADAGAAFGSGSSGTVFGARGSGSFLSRTTAVLMALFMILAVFMAWLGQNGDVSKVSSIMAGNNAPVAAPAPQSAGTLQTRTTAPTSMTTQAVNTSTTPAPTPASGSGR